MKERPDSEVPTSGRAAELLASPPLRGRPLPPLHDPETVECARVLTTPTIRRHHHTEPRTRAPLRVKRHGSCAYDAVGTNGRGLTLPRGGPSQPWMLRCLVGGAREPFSHRAVATYPHHTARF